MKTFRAMFGAALIVATFGWAVAKLPPAPPMTDEQKATAEETKAKAAAAAELAKQQQAKAEDRVAAKYFSDMKAKGKAVPASQYVPPAPVAPQPAAATAAAISPAAKPAATPAAPK